MKDIIRAKERFLRDPIPVRLAGISANLGRLSSSARRKTGAKSVEEMLIESQYYIEWTAGALEIDIAAELVDIQVMLSLWRKAWPEAQNNVNQRSILAFQAKKWSDQVLAASGLLD